MTGAGGSTLSENFVGPVVHSSDVDAALEDALCNPEDIQKKSFFLSRIFFYVRGDRGKALEEIMRIQDKAEPLFPDDDLENHVEFLFEEEEKRISENQINADPPAAHNNFPNLAQLLYKDLPRTVWVAKDVLAEGLGIVASPPKFGKSLLVLQLAKDVGIGRPFLGNYATEQGRVLYLALEDGERRLQGRTELQEGGKGNFDPEQFKNVDYLLTFPKAEDGGLEELEAWLTAHPDAKLVIIDTLARFRRAPGRNSNAYLADTEFMAPLQRMALKYHICILLVHHTKKGTVLDPLDAISGTMGLAGVADQSWILKRDNRGNADGMMGIFGRDVDTVEIALGFDKAKLCWNYKGLADEIQKTKERQIIIEYLVDMGEPQRVGDIAKHLGKSQSLTSHLLAKMKAEGSILPGGFGRYYVKR